MAWYNWSQTASSNAGADPTINWAEGQAPSSINDSARAMMAATAKYRDDISGAIVTAGSSTAYTVASNSGFDTLAHLNGQIIAFSPHTTNGATVLLNVDGLGQKPLRSSPGVELQAGTIIQGTPYVAIYNNTDGAFYLQGFYGNPYNTPLGGGMIYIGPSAPNSSFVFPFGQAISRTTYATLFSLIGTTFGVGDGSTTFNVLDLRGLVPAGVDNMGGSSGGRMPSLNLGAIQGTATETIAQGNLPAVAISISGSTSGYTPTVGGVAAIGLASGAGISGYNPAASSSALYPTVSYGALAGFGSLSVSGSTSNLGSGTPISTVQPTIGCNYILRII